MSESKILKEKHDSRVKKIALITMVVLLIAAIGMIIGSADSFYTIRINYVFKDGTPAHDAYVATYHERDEVDLTVTNPNISGFVPMTASEGGVSAATSRFEFDHLDHNVNETVYYIAGLTQYRVMYYKQNIYDDLYTRDNAVPEQYTNRYGYTGSNPTILEEENLFEGFTNLFHEPDAIAADGSTVFRVYYDRNYYTVRFDLGEGGYGVEPIYAKYQSVYHITDPTRLGYIFKGWARTSADSTKGEYGTDWHYIDENGNTISEETASANAFKFYDGEIPAKDQFFKAIWESGTTSYSIVYWFQNPDGRDITAEELNNTSSIAEARTIISTNYSVAASYDVENVQSGSEIDLNTPIPGKSGVTLKDFFSFDLSVNGDFPSMSEAQREELQGKSKYYEFNSAISHLQFGGAHEDDPDKEHITVSGDGTTRINVYFNRKNFTLRFFYARQNYNNNNQLITTYSLTNSTKNFSKKNYYDSNLNYMEALAAGSWQSGVAETLPHVKDEYLVENGGILEEKNVDYIDSSGKKKYRYYYYEISAKYNEPLRGKWFIDAITSVHKKNFDATQICVPGSWATEYGTNFMLNNRNGNGLPGKDNFTVKGIYEKLGDELMFRDRETDYTELMFLLSWTNTEPSRTESWNYGYKRVLHFTYENYTELLPQEIDKMTHDLDNDGNADGPAGLSDTYRDIYVRKNNQFTLVSPDEPFVYDANARYYGIKEENITETIDSGDQYDRPKNSIATITENVRKNQVAASIPGFELENFQQDGTGKAVLDDNNTIVDWSDDVYTGSDEEIYRHATVKFFYHRNTYTLEYRNGNRSDKTVEVMYGAPLNSVYMSSGDDHEAGDYRYWYKDPQYFNEDLRDYYTFEGWYYTPYYYRLVDKDTATMPADDTTFYAKWNPKVINVSFYPNYNDFYQGTNRIGDEIPVNYGDFIPLDDVPADTDDPDVLRPRLIPPTEGAMFAGWYYLRNNVPVRFEPENIPVTALNKQAVNDDNAKLELFAEWATNDIAKYYITYVEKDHPENEVAQPYLGRSFLWKTRTVNAKTGSELNEAHAWSEDGHNWWPTTNSHSLVIRANIMGGASPYEPNVYSFEYVQKRGVYYRVEYRDKTTHAELAPPKDEVYSTHGSVKEDAKFVPGYLVDEMSKTITLTASTAETEAEQKAEELQSNVITFYYNKNDTDYIYEVEYYKQNIDNDDYFLYFTENREVPIAPGGSDTSVGMQELYQTLYARMIEDDGFTRVARASEIMTTDHEGTTTTAGIADDGSVVITGDKKTTVKIYFDRNKYTYKYLYVDYHAERAYLDTPEDERGGMWDGVIETYDGDGPKKVDTVITISAPQDITYNETPYTRIENKDITLTIAPATESNPNVNTVKVYYRKFTERELTYKLSCENEGQSGVRVDYDPITKQPLYGGLSMTLQTVENYNGIAPVTFYNFNEATTDDSGEVEKYLHYHKYTFLGWFDNPEGSGEPLTTDETLGKEDLGLDGSLPERDTTYYAVVHEEMITTDFELRCVEEDLPVGGSDEAETPEDIAAAEIVSSGTTDENGDLTGCYFHLTDPLDYAVGAPIPWNKVEGYSLSIEPKDDKVYKYEFAEWWEEDLDTGKLIRKKEWNSSGDWSPTVLTSQLDRQKNRHVIAVFKRREVTELPYVIDYKFITRTGEEQTFRVKNTLTADQLDETIEQPIITPDGDFRLTDEFLMSIAPYESNHGETITWTDKQIDKTSVKGDQESGTVDRIETTVTALQAPKKVYANYQTTPDGEYEQVEGYIGDNGGINSDMLKIRAADVDGEGRQFSYWAVRKTRNGPVIAKSYRPLFDLCLMDNYYISPVYGEGGQPDESLDIKLTHIDYSRNRWTDENGDIADNGKTDCLYSDFEIAYLGLEDLIQESTDYQVGMVFERCKTLSGEEEFDPEQCDFASDSDNLTSAIKTALANNKTTASYNYDKSDASLKRSIQINALSNEGMTNRNRVEVGKRYYNAKNAAGNYTNSPLVIKVYAYIIVNGEVTLSNPEYICLRAEAQKELAVGNMPIDNT